MAERRTATVANHLDGIRWYVDPGAKDRNEPGLSHSYIASLATALNFTSGGLAPAWLMGASAFAFRIFVNETLCPSAMSIFDWSAILPEAVEQAGRRCIYVSRLWNEDAFEAERRQEAHRAILMAIDRGVPAVVWDVHDVEWGLIVGCDETRALYETLACDGKPTTLPFDRLGRNGIDILSVAIPGKPNGRPREEVVRRSLEAAVAHAEGREWMDRPKYQDGLAAFDLWATLYDRWALITKAGRSDRLSPELPRFVAYYADIHYSARCYAREYLRVIADGDEHLERAAAAYSDVAATLRPVWEHSQGLGDEPADAGNLEELARGIRKAKAAEQGGVAGLRRYLSESGGESPP
jgi:hypothetical protein